MGQLSVRTLVGLAGAASLVVAVLLGTSVPASAATPRALATAAAAPQAVAAPTGPAPVQQRSTSTVTADELPTVQIDSGVVWSQVIVGNTVYVGGSFANARPAGAAVGVNLSPRANVLAYNLVTGALVTGWAPSLNGVVKAMAASPDGRTIYVGGSFSTANGVGRFDIAAFDATTGALVTTFKATAGGSYVNSIVATATVVYAGGLLNAGNGVKRSNLVAWSVSNGALLGWAPTTDLQVDTMVMAPGGSRLIVGGRFGLVNGVAQRGMAALSPADGSILPWTAPTIIQNGGGTGTSAGKAGIWSLSTDGLAVFGTTWVFSNTTIGNLEGSFSAQPVTGNINWIEDCHGDEYGSYSDTVNVYVIGHPHDCVTVGGYPQANPAPGNMRHALAFTAAAKGILGHTPTAGTIYKDWAGQPSPAVIDWYPDFVTGSFTGQGQAAWSIAGAGDYVVLGGEFPIVNGQPQYGIARFARATVAPSKEAPRLSNARWVPAVTSYESGQVRLSIPLNWDRDDLTLNYQIYRSGTVAPTYTSSLTSTFWNTPPLSFTDNGLTPGSTFTYRVVASDPNGNTSASLPVAVTVGSSPISPYAAQVLADSASTYWRLGETTSSTTAFDWSGTNDAAIGPSVTRTATGAFAGDPNTASTFDGTANSTVSSQVPTAAPNTFSAQAWFRTTTTTGGKIIGFGNYETGSSNNYDRHVYLGNDGTLHFGVYSGGIRSIDTARSYNDGQWHQVVATMGPGGMVFWVDGIQIGANSAVTTGQPFTGYWRVGGDNLAGWPKAPTNSYLAGDIDDVSIYSSVLTKTQIRRQYTTAGYNVAIPAAPADVYGAAVYNGDPDAYWRFDDAPGTTVAADAGQNTNPGTVVGPLSFGQVGALQTGAIKAAQFGTNTFVVSGRQLTNPTVYSEAAWFRTSTTTGGRILGFGNANVGLSATYDRIVYLQNNGQIAFGTNTAVRNIIVSPASYNDGKWHQVVADQGPAGMELWVDGLRVGTNAQTAAQNISGYWRVGGDSTWNSATPWFAGLIDEAAFYSRVLSPAEIGSQYSLGSTVPPPTASFTASASYLSASVDATASFAGNGRTIAGSTWNWGDNSANGTGLTASHTYAAAGTYSITLTLTDNKGLVGSSSRSLTVAAPHVTPTAVIGVGSPGTLSVAFNGAGSTASDGATISSYAWNFGDGATSTLPAPVHPYALPGTYQVKLVVTDSLGAVSAPAVASVVVTHAAPSAAFAGSANFLVVSVDASATTTSDSATVTGYDWNWGDGSPHGAGISATHTFSTAGPQSVTLTVTDNFGATGTITHIVTTTTHSAPVASISSTPASLTVGFDGTGSAASDGASISSYAWSFGDGTTSAAAQPSHAYAAAGTYQVSLTVTDSLGASSAAAAASVTVTHSVPVAVVAAAPASLTVALDGTGSTASDGAAIASYAWGFGDGSTSSAAQPSHAYAAAGTYQVSLTVTDSSGASSIQVISSVTVTHNAPTAAFTSTVNQLLVSVDGSSASTADGATITGYDWNWGDGSLHGTGITAGHTFAAAGPQSITLTVTDSLGATATLTNAVTAIDNLLAADAFNRTVITGWGTADTGGPWSGTTNFSVASGGAQLALVRGGQTSTTYLTGSNLLNVNAAVDLSWDKLADGSGEQMNYVVRHFAGGEYRSKIRVSSVGVVTISIAKLVGTTETVIANKVLPGVTYVPGQALRMRFSVSGTSPTTLSTKVWNASAAEPGAWLLSVTDSEPTLQTAGQIGLQAYQAASVTTVPVTMTFDNLLVLKP